MLGCTFLVEHHLTRRQHDQHLPQDAPLASDYPEPRAGRLVAEDEGAHPDAEADLVARDVGIDAGAAGAEEAAVHVQDEADV